MGEKSYKSYSLSTYGGTVGITQARGNPGGKEITMECRNCDYYKAKNCKHQCMFLPDGMTCGDCINFDWCSMAYSVKSEYTSCDFEPIRFKVKELNHG